MSMLILSLYETSLIVFFVFMISYGLVIKDLIILIGSIIYLLTIVIPVIIFNHKNILMISVMINNMFNFKTNDDEYVAAFRKNFPTRYKIPEPIKLSISQAVIINTGTKAYNENTHSNYIFTKDEEMYIVDFEGSKGVYVRRAFYPYIDNVEQYRVSNFYRYLVNIKDVHPIYENNKLDRSSKLNNLYIDF